MKSTIQKISSKAGPSIINERDPAVDAEERLNCIATAAYYKAEARSFIPGREFDDWLEAEAEFFKREMP